MTEYDLTQLRQSLGPLGQVYDALLPQIRANDAEGLASNASTLARSPDDNIKMVRAAAITSIVYSSEPCLRKMFSFYTNAPDNAKNHAKTEFLAAGFFQWAFAKGTKPIIELTFDAAQQLASFNTAQQIRLPGDLYTPYKGFSECSINEKNAFECLFQRLFENRCSQDFFTDVGSTIKLKSIKLSKDRFQRFLKETILPKIIQQNNLTALTTLFELVLDFHTGRSFYPKELRNIIDWMSQSKKAIEHSSWDCACFIMASDVFSMNSDENPEVFAALRQSIVNLTSSQMHLADDPVKHLQQALTIVSRGLAYSDDEHPILLNQLARIEFPLLMFRLDEIRNLHETKFKSSVLELIEVLGYGTEKPEFPDLPHRGPPLLSFRAGLNQRIIAILREKGYFNPHASRNIFHYIAEDAAHHPNAYLKPCQINFINWYSTDDILRCYNSYRESQPFHIIENRLQLIPLGTDPNSISPSVAFPET